MGTSAELSVADNAVLGSYRILGRVGEGGMGTVYRARHVDDAVARQQGGDVVIKLLHAQFVPQPELVQRLFREAELGMRLSHPRLLHVYETLQEGGRFGMVMSWAEGRPMSTMIGHETGPIPWGRARPLVDQLLDAIGYAHRAGVVHPDLTPENIMVDDAGDLKVLGFGIAKASWERGPKTGMGLGTVDYVAPERYSRADVDARADIYALGMTLYEMVAGRLPWAPDASEFEVLSLKSRMAFPPPTHFYPSIPRHVVATIMACLRVDVADRPATVEALRGMLDDPSLTLTGTPWQATPPPATLPTVPTAPVLRPPPLLAAPTGATASMGALPVALLGAAVGLLGLSAVFVVNRETPPPPPAPAPVAVAPTPAAAVVAPPAPAQLAAPVAPEVRRVSTPMDSHRRESRFGTMVWVPPGSFFMGSPSYEPGHESDEPQREVRITQGFYLMEHEVTQAQWEEVLGTSPSRFRCSRCPVDNVSWDEVQRFLISADQGDSITYRLPTEAEWEYAARAGEGTVYAGSDDVGSVGWYVGNSRKSTQAACSLGRNALGLCDMSGNVWEWVQDAYSVPTGASQTDPVNRYGGDDRRVFRGGSWFNKPDNLRVASRDGQPAWKAGAYIGFRVAANHLDAKDAP
jgi:formylglycine-generating enzyme required for sulfatase activity